LSLPVLVPGLVIRYSYLSKREHDSDRDEGIKDRPCTVLLAIKDSEGEMIVTVLRSRIPRPSPNPTQSRFRR
jgi:hypothetical protein